MAIKPKSRKEYRERRHRRLRRKIHGTAQRPRMSIAVSNRCIQVQFIDDDRAATLAALSSRGLADDPGGKTVDTARRLGEAAGRLAAERGIRTVVCDRGGRTYHGRIKALADAVRAAGLLF